MIKASYNDKEIVTDILVSAFKHYDKGNSINLVVKQDKKRIKRMRVLMSYLFERAMLFGEVYLTDNKKGCLLLKYPHHEKTTLKTIGLDIKLALKCIGIERVYKVLQRQHIAHKNYPKEKHIRPIILGVKQEEIGKGNAARLMLELMQQFKDNDLPVVIDTATEKNVRLYKKLGFKIISKEESLGFPIYFLRLN